MTQESEAVIRSLLERVGLQEQPEKASFGSTERIWNVIQPEDTKTPLANISFITMTAGTRVAAHIRMSLNPEQHLAVTEWFKMRFAAELDLQFPQE